MSSGHCERQRSVRVQGAREPWVVCLLTAGIWFAGVLLGFAAETADPVALKTTVVVLKLDTGKPLAIRTLFQPQPPSIMIEFPPRRVIGSLPERSIVDKGIIKALVTRYEDTEPQAPKRFVQSLRIVLSEPYPHRVRSEPGRVVIAIDHPAHVGSAAVEVKLRGGTIIGALAPRNVSERFRAMQEALTQASPQPFLWQITSRHAEPAPTAPPELLAERPEAQGLPRPPEVLVEPRRALQPGSGGRSPRWWAVGSVGIGLSGLAGLLWILLRRRKLGVLLGQTVSVGRGTRLAPGLTLIDQLVWRALEQAGWQLVRDVGLLHPRGTVHVMVKDQEEAALLCIGNGLFFEKQTVEEFVAAMRQVNVKQGFLVGTGSFTVPAQRLAKEAHVTLIGREQLVELLSTGAMSEWVARQLGELKTRIAESEQALRQVTEDLGLMRRQRNEASWYLGEERAKSATLQATLEAQDQRLRQQEAHLRRWEQEAATLRRQWEESQWYLGESRERTRHLEAQLSAVQELAQRVDRAQRERDESSWSLGEERQKREALLQEMATLQGALEASVSQVGVLQETCQWLTQELQAVRIHGERRSHPRVRIPNASVELSSDGVQVPFAGSLLDVSGVGMKVATDREVPAVSSWRARLSLPGAPEPIEAQATLVWQRATDDLSRYLSGYQFGDLSEAVRERLQQSIEQSL